MGEANEVAENGYMRDLLQRFTAGNHHRKQTEYKSPNEEETEEMELNLGLSLGGCFGVDPKEKRLIRSSSISGSTRLIRNEDLTLTRTSSLPVETEEERRKRKELQSLRRLEAMRKRSEKQRNFRVGKDGASLGGICEEDKVVVEEEEEEEERLIMPILGSKLKIEQQFNMVSKGFSPSVGLLNWVAPVPALRGFVQPLSQGSIGSQGSSSSGISEFESRPSQGLSNSAEGRRSPASVQSLPEQYERKPIIAPRARSATTEKSDISTGVEVEENPSKKAKVTEDNGSTREMGMKVMEEMPYVSTTGGDGPNGKRIEGFLYKYRKGEEVRIMCVCHGNFLSPAEFVKHAGGGDVEHPLRHIVVNPSHSLS